VSRSLAAAAAVVIGAHHAVSKAVARHPFGKKLSSRPEAEALDQAVGLLRELLAEMPAVPATDADPVVAVTLTGAERALLMTFGERLGICVQGEPGEDAPTWGYLVDGPQEVATLKALCARIAETAS
jgi:hypothetical protein